MYIDANKQKEMIRLINEFYEESEDGIYKTVKSDLIMNKLFKNYVDKIILGIIRSPMYKYYQYAEEDELVCEAQFHIYQSILKKQWDPEKGASIFSFFSTVVARNLKTYTQNLNKKTKRNSGVLLEDLQKEETLFWFEDFDRGFINAYIFDEIEKYFHDNGKHKLLKLSKIFRDYFLHNSHQKFKKKLFVAYAASYGFSQSFCNTFFEALKKIKNLRNVWEELYKENFSSNTKINYKGYE
jgi:hypothetical protein